MNSIYKFTICLVLAAHCAMGASAAPAESWPYWPKYENTPLDEICPQKWMETDHVIDGWDWSLPPNVKPAPNGLLAVNRTSNLYQPLEKHVSPLNLPFNHPIKMWMVEPDRHFDYIARKGKRIGLAVDDRWCGGGPVKVALKVTYFDRGRSGIVVCAGDQVESLNTLN